MPSTLITLNELGDIPFRYRKIDLTNPIANAEYPSQTVPADVFWILIGFGGNLVTDANAPGGGRLFRIVVQDEADTEYLGMHAAFNQGASQSIGYRGFPSGHGSVDGHGGITARLNPVVLTQFPLTEGHDIIFATSNRQVGDDWGQGNLLIAEFFGRIPFGYSDIRPQEVLRPFAFKFGRPMLGRLPLA